MDTLTQSIGGHPVHRIRARRPLLAASGIMALAVSALSPSAQAQRASETFRVHAEGVPDQVVADLQADLAWAEARISKMLGPFPDTVSTQVFPGRAGFDAALREAWGIPQTACWMVGAADDHHLYLLSPAVWDSEACEHDADDATHRRLLVTHEAVHVYHGQVNPSDDVGLLEDVGWFVEGLATYVSGQLETSHAGRAEEALAARAGPNRLADAWSGAYRYGVAGSLAAFVDQRWGRDTLIAALEITSQDAFLGLLNMADEEEFLAAWQAWVTSR
jgi:hypothetical protein